MSEATIQEKCENLVTTEGGLLIEVAGYCEGFMPCDEACEYQYHDSGKVTIINVCTLPITITGMVLSDPVRFSLFSYPEYKGTEIYDSTNTIHFPLTLEPRQKTGINTFFHPLKEELINGKAGTSWSYLENTGDQFGSRVNIFPGFPILNCESADPCDAHFYLTGSFICPEPRDLTYLLNNDNFIDTEPLPDEFQPPENDDQPKPNICPFYEDEVELKIKINYDEEEPAEGTEEEPAEGTTEESVEETEKTFLEQEFTGYYKTINGKWNTKIGEEEYKEGHSEYTYTAPGQINESAKILIVVPNYDSDSGEGGINKGDLPVLFASWEEEENKFYSITVDENDNSNTFDSIENTEIKPESFPDMEIPSEGQIDCDNSLSS